MRAWFYTGDHPPAHSHPCGPFLFILDLDILESERPQAWQVWEWAGGWSPMSIQMRMIWGMRVCSDLQVQLS